MPCLILPVPSLIYLSTYCPSTSHFTCRRPAQPYITCPISSYLSLSLTFSLVSISAISHLICLRPASPCLTSPVSVSSFCTYHICLHPPPQHLTLPVLLLSLPVSVFPLSYLSMFCSVFLLSVTVQLHLTSPQPRPTPPRLDVTCSLSATSRFLSVAILAITSRGPSGTCVMRDASRVFLWLQNLPPPFYGARKVVYALIMDRKESSLWADSVRRMVLAKSDEVFLVCLIFSSYHQLFSVTLSHSTWVYFTFLPPSFASCCSSFVPLPL